jgi:hypothetical protein
MRAVVSGFPLAACLAFWAAVATAAEGGGALFSAATSLSTGLQEHNRESIYPPEGSESRPSTVSLKLASVLRFTRPGVFLALFDGQLDHRPYADETDDTRLNQLFGVYDYSESWKFRVGKQRVLWGHGFAYIPTDFINPPLDPTGLDLAKEGVEAVSVDYFSRLFSLTGVLTRGDELTVDGAGLKATSSAISGLDANLVYFHSDQVGHAGGLSFASDSSVMPWAPWPGLILSGGVGVHQRSRYPRIVDTTVATPGGPVSFPAVGTSGAEGPYYSFLTGLSYEVVSRRLALRGEYYHIGDAYSRGEYRHLLDALSDSASPRGGLASPWLDQLAPGRSQRDYLNLSAGQRAITEGGGRVLDTLGYELGVLWGLEDASGLLSATVNSRYWNHTELSLRAFLPVGDRRSEFGTLPFDWYVEAGIKVAF